MAAVRIVRPRAWGDDRFTNGWELKHMMMELAAAGPVYLWTQSRLPPRFDKEVGPSPIPNDGTHDIVDWNLSVQTFINENEGSFKRCPTCSTASRCWRYHF